MRWKVVTSDSLSLAERLMGDRRILMQGVRARYSLAEPEGGNYWQRGIVEATNAVENIFFLLAQLTLEFRNGRFPRERAPKPKPR